MPCFSEWLLEDIDGCISVCDGRVSWVCADRSKVRYLAKEIDTVGNFQHSYIACLLEGSVEDELNVGLIRFWELRNDWDNRVWVYARKCEESWTIHFEQRHHGEDILAFHGSRQFEFQKRYWIEILRSGSLYRLVVKNDVCTELLEDSGDIEGVNYPYCRVWLVSTIKSRRNNGNWSTGYIENYQKE